MSKVLIAYASKHGCTEECAKALAAKLTEEADLWNLREKKPVDLSTYDKIVIGGSVYAGRIQKEVRDFCIRNEEALKAKKLGLFLSGTAEGEASQKELEASFPQEIFNAALTREFLGGRITVNQLGFLEKKIVKMVAKVVSDMSNLSEDCLNRLAQRINEA